MPEIKHNFTKGRMNKDLDERLVPKGEYTDAMNVQVSTSDTGNVGSVQNLLGNKDMMYHVVNGSLTPFNLPAGAQCVGVIADEKNNVLYWFVTSSTLDGIIRYKKETSDVEWIFTDPNKNTLKFPTPNYFNDYEIQTVTGINIIDDLIFWTDGVNEPRKINITKCFEGTTTDYTVQTKIQTLSGPVDITEEHITVIKKPPNNALTLDLKTSRVLNREAIGSGFNLSYSASVAISNDESNLTDDIIEVTPVDDQTNPYNAYNFSNVRIGDRVKIQLLKDVQGNDDFELEWIKGVEGGGASGANSTNTPWAGQKIVLKEYTDGGDVPPLPITDYTIKGVLTNYFNPDNPSLISDSDNFNDDDDSGRVIVEFLVTNTNGVPPSASTGETLRYAVDLLDESEKLFEFKFPRFSYRYKYEDNEYSTFAPWTQVAFVPGSFDYHPKKGYNIGMTNRLSSCVINNFVPQDIPLDVKEVEILYKEEGSTTIYAVESIKRDETKTVNLDGDFFNYWQLNYYEVKDETINKILPENQYLRPFDNVPTSALAQEITGNRIVYGNYKQGHDVMINGWNEGPVEEPYYPIIQASVVNSSLAPSTYAVKSIKSLREYQLGMLFVDKYGRETPIITTQTSTFKVEKDKASTANRLQVSITNHQAPIDEDLMYYKFFIKETSGEYYNLAMDRWYDAGDGNRWISFASSDINKIDIDTFLILKKAQESNTLITEPARYKILAIENEAPDYIKIDKRLVASATHTAGDEVFYAGLVDNPVFAEQTLTLKYEAFANSSGSLLHELQDGELWLDFGIVGSTVRSLRYRVSEITKTGSGGSENYSITLSTSLGHDVDFIADDPASPTGIADNVVIRFFNYKVENKASFDGRFFVKIFGDDIFKRTFESDSIINQTLYRIIDERIQYSIFPNHDTLHSQTATGQNFGEYGYEAGLGRWAVYFRNYNKLDSAYSWFGDSTGGCNSDGDYTLGFPLGRFAFDNPFFDENDLPGLDGCGLSDPRPGWLQEAIRQTFFEYSAWNTSNTNQPEKFLHQKHGTYLTNTGGMGGNGNWPGQWDYTRYIQNEVWFIDGGPFVGKQSTSNLTWPVLGSGAGTNDGIVTYSNSWAMYLGFGPIAPPNQDAPFNSPDNQWGAGPHDNFWNVGTEVDTNSQYADQSTRNWVRNYSTGSQFRFEDDPNQTIYTVTTDSTVGLANYETIRDTNDAPLHGLSINKRKNWYLQFTPAISWIPYDGTFGPIQNGYQLDINAEIGPNSVTADNGTVGTLEDYCIYLETNVATCNNTGQQNVIIKPGMIVTQYNNGSNALTHASIDDASPVLQVKSISKTATFTKVVLCGYVNALDVTHCITPTDGQSVRFEQAKSNGYSPNSANRISLNKSNDESMNLLKAVGHNMQFVEIAEFDNVLPENPAIWETEPKEQTDLDIYHEISGYNPTVLNFQTANTTIPIGSTVELVNPNGAHGGSVVEGYYIWPDDNGTEFLVLQLSKTTSSLQGFPDPASRLRITRPDGTSFETIVAVTPSEDFGNEVLNEDGIPQSKTTWDYLVALSRNTPFNYILNWHNCYSFLNGVESNRIRDNFNLPFISSGPRVSTVFEQGIFKEHKSSGLIYSGLYNSSTGVNSLNQFIVAEKITKDINPIHGSIQKLFSRDTDLIALCEDKVLKILANKDALFNADGNPQLVASKNVLGQTVPFVGDYGISKNPESFASESYRAYFSDKTRGSIIRLSKDGLTPISDHGMKQYFKDNLKNTAKIIGSYDDSKKEYNVKLSYIDTSKDKVVSFKEDVKGWVSFKSFIQMSHGVSCSNEYYTFASGKLWNHHVEIPDEYTSKINNYNKFYNVYTPSSVKFLLNDSPGIVKSFKTINYEGSRSRIVQSAPGVTTVTDLHENPILFPGEITDWNDGDYYNELPGDGWYAESISTDLEEGSIKEFIKKENKYFNFIRGVNGLNYNGNWEVDLDTGSLNVQGLGKVTSTPVPLNIFGCMDPAAFNYNPAANTNATSASDPTDPCVAIVTGCIDLNAYNYNPYANTDSGICVYPGCTDNGVVSIEMSSDGVNMGGNDWSPFPGVAANNYDPGATIACGNNSAHPHTSNSVDYNACCTYTFTGCTDSTAFNYNSDANIDDGSCVPVVLGCTDQNADNYDPLANTEDSSCIYYGCMDITSDNYIVPNPSQASLDNGVYNSGSGILHAHGFQLALAGMPSFIGSDYGTLEDPYVGTEYGCPDWSFAPDIFGTFGQSPPPDGIGVLIPHLIEDATCSSKPLAEGDWQNYENGCDPTIPYQPIIYIGGSYAPQGYYLDNQFGNNPPNTPDGNGGILPTWPNVSYALDVNGNQIPFTHQWWNPSGTFNPLQHLVNPYPPCATVDDGGCAYSGCTDVAAANYDDTVTNPDNSTCLYCGDTADNVTNYDGALDVNGGEYQDGCVYCPNEDQFGLYNVTTVYNTAPGANDWDFNPVGSEIQISLFINTTTATGFIFNSPQVDVYYRLTDIGGGVPGSWLQLTAPYGSGNATLVAVSGGFEIDYILGGLTPDTSYDVKFTSNCFIDPSNYWNIEVFEPETTAIVTAPGPGTGCLDPTAINYCPTCTVDDPSTCLFTGCTIVEDANYIGGTVSCNDPGGSVTLSQPYQIDNPGNNWDCYSETVAQTHPDYPNNLSIPLTDMHGQNVYIMEGLLYGLNNECCSWYSENPDGSLGDWLTFNGESTQGPGGYYGCKDPTAENYCPGCVEDLQVDYGIHWCEYDGCANNTAGNNPDVNGYCADATYDQLLNQYQTFGVLGNVGTTPASCVDGGSEIGYLSQNFDPKVNAQPFNSFNNCTYEGCDVTCFTEYNWNTEYPTGDDTCVGGSESGSVTYTYDLGTPGGPGLATDPYVDENGVTQDPFQHAYKLGLWDGPFNKNNESNQWGFNLNFYFTQDDDVVSGDPCTNCGVFYRRNMSSGDQQAAWFIPQFAVIAAPEHNYGSTDHSVASYKKACVTDWYTSVGDPSSTGCLPACYDINGVQDDSVQSTPSNAGHIPFNWEEYYLLDAELNEVNCHVVAPGKSALTGNDINGAYYKFEYTPGDTWNETNVPSTFTHVDYIGVEQLWFNHQIGAVNMIFGGYDAGDDVSTGQFEYLPDGTHRGGLKAARFYCEGELWAGNNTFTKPACGNSTTVKWGIYQNCQNGEKQIAPLDGYASGQEPEPGIFNSDGQEW